MLVLYTVLAIAGVITFIWLFNFEKELRAKWYAILLMSVAVVALGLLSAIIFAKFENFLSGTNDGNMSIYGGIFLMPIFCAIGALLFRRKVKLVLDVLTLPIVSVATLARVNCLIKGCCLGSFIPGTTTRWPTREIELVYDVIFLIIIARITAKKRFRGYNYPLYLLSYGVLRFIVQWFRDGGFEVIGPLTLSHIWSILSIIAGSLLILLIYKAEKKDDIELKTKGNKKKLNKSM